MDLPDWHVNGAGIREEDALSDGYPGITATYIVPYVIDSGPAAGTQGSVRVTQADFTADTVRGRIETQVAAKHMVAGLGSSGA